ncbi:prepilin peptidase [Furfurilactobacillus siliginis]|nr:A24 family peptidase [Furfurilactobacillus siliginis]
MSLFLSLVSPLYAIVFTSTVMCLADRLTTSSIIDTPRSVCDHCRRQLTWWQLVPIFGWLCQRGRCHFCHVAISARYVLYEISIGILTTCLSLRTSFHLTWATICFLLVLLALAEIDRIMTSVPTVLNVILLLAALTLRQPPLREWGCLFVVFILGQLVLHYHPVLGNGDLDIMIIFVIAWGWLAMTQIVLISCVLALLRQRHSQPLQQPFIPDLWRGCLTFCFLHVFTLI